jgi:hypothetical protein
VGIPVHVHYVGTGDNIMVDRVNSFLSIRAFWFCPVGGTTKARLAYVQLQKLFFQRLGNCE